MCVPSKEIQLVRLSSFELDAIRNCFQRSFTSEDHLWIFGSRIRPEKKGGDIDLYIEIQSLSIEESMERKLNFLVDLKTGIGDQKIDVVLNHLPSTLVRPIFQEARKEGIMLL